jgi:hypothetical protein
VITDICFCVCISAHVCAEYSLGTHSLGTTSETREQLASLWAKLRICRREVSVYICNFALERFCRTSSARRASSKILSGKMKSRDGQLSSDVYLECGLIFASAQASSSILNADPEAAA